MKTRPITILVTFVAILPSLSALAHADDAAIGKQLVGSWKGPSDQTIVLNENGVMTDSENPATSERWDVRDGVFHTYYQDEDGGTSGENFFKIISLTKAKFVIQDMYHGRHTGTWTRIAIPSESRASDQGDITDGNSLQRSLRLYKRYADGVKLKTDEILNVFMTIGYMKGLVGGCEPWAMLDKTGCPYALPRMPLTQLIQVVDKYLADHPEQLHQPAQSLFFAAITNSFPNPDFKKRD